MGSCGLGPIFLVTGGAGRRWHWLWFPARAGGGVGSLSLVRGVAMAAVGDIVACPRWSAALAWVRTVALALSWWAAAFACGGCWQAPAWAWLVALAGPLSSGGRRWRGGGWPPSRWLLLLGPWCGGGSGRGCRCFLTVICGVGVRAPGGIGSVMVGGAFLCEGCLRAPAWAWLVALADLLSYSGRSWRVGGRSPSRCRAPPGCPCWRLRCGSGSAVIPSCVVHLCGPRCWRHGSLAVAWEYCVAWFGMVRGQWGASAVL